MSKAKYIIIDTETTGLWTNHNGLMEFAAAILDEKLTILETIEFDIKPPEDRKVEQVSLKMTGFTKKRISEGLPYADAADKIHKFISQHFLTSKPTFIGQFYPFDYAFVVDLFTSTNRVDKLESFMSNQFIDTKSFVIMANLRSELKNEQRPFPCTSLSSRGGLKEKFGISSTDYEAHTALGDVLATHAVLLQLTQFKNI